MKLISAYSVAIKDYNHIFKPTVDIYRSAVDFFIQVVSAEWDVYKDITFANAAVSITERLTVTNKARPFVKYDFGKRFYKFPCYLRRAAIMEAYGKVKSFQSNLAHWKAEPPATRGKKPSQPKAGCVYPALYRDNCYIRTGSYTAELKVFIHNTWDWITVHFRKSDVDYIQHHCIGLHECSPTLQKRSKRWFLDFPYEEKVTLNNTDIQHQVAVAVDLGINNACTCSVITSDGTILDRRFLSLPREQDSLIHSLNKVKKAQQHGNRHMPRLQAAANGINKHIAVLTAQHIVAVATEYNADVIVFEYLDTNGKKHGFNKQRLHHWRCQYVQAMVEHKAHRLGIRISHICAWGTSRLAFDGSGVVKRGKEAKLASYSLCRFSNGKIYNCDLSASYNIGARYFIREIIKSLPETARLQLQAKAPEVCKRSTCTLSTLINLNAVLAA